MAPREPWCGSPRSPWPASPLGEGQLQASPPSFQVPLKPNRRKRGSECRVGGFLVLAPGHSEIPGLLLEWWTCVGPQDGALRWPGVTHLTDSGLNPRSACLPCWALAPCPRWASPLWASHSSCAHWGHLCLPPLALPRLLFLVSLVPSLVADAQEALSEGLANG